MIPIPSQYSEITDIQEKIDAQDARAIVVVSAEPGEGRTSVAYSLARRAAASGKKTLLVDFNVANPALADEMGLPMVEWSPDEDSRIKAIMPMSETGLHVLTAPASKNFVAHNHETSVLRECISLWRDMFDMIVIDTSPLNRRNQANIPPHVLAAICDGAVFVVLAGTTPESQVVDARARLKSTGAKVLGAVINDFENPSLPSEIQRETRRLDGRLPKLMERIRRFAGRNAFLNQEI